MTNTPADVATRLEHLTRVMHPRGRGPYTDAEIARAISAGETVGGSRRDPVPISSDDLAALRAGRPTAITEDHLAAIAGFFGVTAAYFTDSDKAADLDEQLRLLELLRDTGAQVHACQPVSRRTLIDLLETAQRAEATRWGGGGAGSA